MQLQEPIAILGFGTEGQYALEFLRKQGYKNITVCDEKESPTAFDDLTRFATIIRSPGVLIHKPQIQKAIDAGVTLTSLTKLTLQVAADRLTAITGSNGKTTTTALTAAILTAHYGSHLIVGGNDKTPILQEALDRPKDPIVMEVSSFQFIDLDRSPYIAALLNITPNHMDWHKTMDEYIHAKANLLKFQSEDDWAVLNALDENVLKAAHVSKAQPFWIGQKKGPHWAMWDRGHLLLTFDGDTRVLLHQEDLRVKTHPDNLLFAAAIGVIHMVPESTIIEQMKLFTGVEHRLEYIRTLRDIHFYNDSSCTTPESAEVALTQFPPNRLILMLGGSSKKSDFSYLAERITDLGVRVYLYGAEGESIRHAVEEAGGEGLILAQNTSGDFRQIVQDVYQKAKPEDSIVLSPACASFDMFKNAKERGKLFKQYVMELS